MSESVFDGVLNSSRICIYSVSTAYPGSKLSLRVHLFPEAGSPSPMITEKSDFCREQPTVRQSRAP